MSNFQIVIMPAQSKDLPVDEKERFGVRQHGRSAGKIIERIDDLEGIWGQVIGKLANIATKSQAAKASQYNLDSIEFNIGIEAGLSVGLVTKGDASVSITFKRKQSSD